MKQRKKKAGFWDERINCEIEVRMFLKRNNLTEIPTTEEFKHEGGIPQKALTMLGGRKGISAMTGLPIRKNAYPDRTNPEKLDSLEAVDVIPSKAFQIEKEAREKGLRYADIQKAKTLAMVGGVQI